MCASGTRQRSILDRTMIFHLKLIPTWVGPGVHYTTEDTGWVMCDGGVVVGLCVAVPQVDTSGHLRLKQTVCSENVAR